MEKTTKERISDWLLFLGYVIVIGAIIYFGHIYQTGVVFPKG